MLCVIQNIYSQNLLSKEDLNRLPKSKKHLYERIITSNLYEDTKINDFLAKNKNTKRTFTSKNGKTFVIYKILNGKPIYRTTDNDDAALATKTNELHVGGSLGLNLDGDGITVGVWDGGPVQTTHAEFQNTNNTASRVTNNENITTEGNLEDDDHASHVTGIIAAKGVDARAKGMAPKASIFTFNFIDDRPEIVSVLSNPLSNMFISNHSYGIPIDQEDGNTLDAWVMGSYNSDASELDDILRTYPEYLMVKSAGNSGEVNYVGGLFGGFDKLTASSTAKNNLVVANASPALNPFTGGLSALVINTSSSQGPTDDLRIKPDIAGDGTGLFSPTTADGYSTFSGTSMSAPNVTGSLVLLQQYYNQLNGNYMKASTLKGLACHTTVDDDTNAGPDPIFGWGFLDAMAAAETITGNSNGSAIINELTLNDSESYTINFSAQAGQKLSATICWTDIKGVPSSGESDLNNQTPKLINDLDIRITKDGTTYFPWKLEYSSTTGFSNTKADNFVDNVERIDIEAPETGTYQITVSHKGTLKIPGPFQTPPLTQDFSLIVTGAGISTLGSQDFEASGFAIWPNPANDVVNFKVKSLNGSKVILSLIDVQGRKVFSNTQNVNGQFIEGQIPVNNIQKGIYILNIKQNNTTISKKVVIQ